jgi:hypothetical protein
MPAPNPPSAASLDQSTAAVHARGSDHAIVTHKFLVRYSYHDDDRQDFDEATTLATRVLAGPALVAG